MYPFARPEPLDPNREYFDRQRNPGDKVMDEIRNQLEGIEPKSSTWA